MVVSTTRDAHEFAKALVGDYFEKQQATVERKKFEEKKSLSVGKDDRDLRKVSEIDYGRHEQLAKQLDKEDEIKVLEQKAKVVSCTYI